LKDGRCVRLVEGRKDKETVYGRDPVEAALGYQQAGALKIHVVDLDGAFLGAASENQKIIQRIVSNTTTPVEVGGGIRSISDIEHLLVTIGAAEAILGTTAVERPEILREAVNMFSEGIVVGIDARGREVATRGWTHASQIDAIELARQVAAVGVKRIIFTDITRDGKLEGPNVELTREIAVASGARITASGGVSSLDDISRLRELEADGVDSVIVGKALYERRFTLQEAIEAAK